MAVVLVRVTTRKLVHVFGTIGWRMNWLVEEITAGGVTISVEAGHPSWWGGPSGMNEVTRHTSSFGEELAARVRLSSLLPIPKTVRGVPRGASATEADLQLTLPLGWYIEIEELPSEEEIDNG